MTPQEAIERALAASKADDCIVIASASHGVNVRWANNTLTTNGIAGSTDLTVVSILRGSTTQTGSVTWTGVTDDEIADLVATSEAAARAALPSDDVAPLVEKRDATGWDLVPSETSAGALEQVSRGLAEAFDSARSRDEGRFGYAEHTVTTTYLGSSSGLRLRDEQEDGRLELTGRSTDGSRSAWAGSRSPSPAGMDVAALERDVAQRLDWARRRVDLDAGRYDTVLPPSAVADLMVDAYWSMGALDAHEGSTVYARPGGGTRVGESLTDVPLTMRSDPAMPGQECTPFVIASASSRLSSVFDNGLPIEPVDWIREGTLTSLLQTRHSAEVTGLPVTPWVDNLEITSSTGKGDTAALVADVERGLLLTCLWYIRLVDPQTMLLTGLTRDGVFLIENGEVVGGVNNFRFNESPVGMLRRIKAVGATQNTFARELGDYFTHTRMPPLRIADFNMSSVSQAT